MSIIDKIKEDLDTSHTNACAWNLLLIGNLEKRIEQLEATLAKIVGDLYEKDQP